MFGAKAKIRKSREIPYWVKCDTEGNLIHCKGCAEQFNAGLKKAVEKLPLFVDRTSGKTEHDNGWNAYRTKAVKAIEAEIKE